MLASTEGQPNFTGGLGSDAEGPRDQVPIDSHWGLDHLWVTQRATPPSQGWAQKDSQDWVPMDTRLGSDLDPCKGLAKRGPRRKCAH
jgi:hypothetical protein